MAPTARREAVAATRSPSVRNPSNSNYTKNICNVQVPFCALSKGPLSPTAGATPYLLDPGRSSAGSVEGRRVWRPTEVGASRAGIHPDFGRRVLLSFCGRDAVAGGAGGPPSHLPKNPPRGGGGWGLTRRSRDRRRRADSFSTLRMAQARTTLALAKGRGAGPLASRPGTAAESSTTRWRAVICPRQVDTRVARRRNRLAHSGRAALENVTIMFGTVRAPVHVRGATWCRPRATWQKETGGFTEFVPLPSWHHGQPDSTSRGEVAALGRHAPEGTGWNFQRRSGRIALPRAGSTTWQVCRGLKGRGSRRAPRRSSAGCNDPRGQIMERRNLRVPPAPKPRPGSSTTTAFRSNRRGPLGRLREQRTTFFVRAAPPPSAFGGCGGTGRHAPTGGPRFTLRTCPGVAVALRRGAPGDSLSDIDVVGIATHSSTVGIEPRKDDGVPHVPRPSRRAR